MKMGYLLSWIAFFCSASASAVVVDQFSCKLDIQIGQGERVKKIRTTRRLASIRFPTTLDTRSSIIHFTQSELKDTLVFTLLDQDEKPLRAHMDFSLSYRHAVRVTPEQEAASTHCLSGSFMTCDETNGCSAIDTACVLPGVDPFDPSSGWTRVKIENGVPKLNAEKFLQTLTLHGKEDPENGNHPYLGEVHIDCTHEGTWN